MIAHVRAFLQHLDLNRNASAHTVGAYATDLEQFLAHAASQAGVKPAALDPSSMNRTAIRSFLAALHAQGQSRASAARKLAAVRTFMRYLRREDVIPDDPGALVATPKREVRMPAHLSEEEMSRLLDSPLVTAPWGAAIARFWSSSTRQDCAAASWRGSTWTT